MLFALTEAQNAYLAMTMKGVSRSFALVTPSVEAPLNDYLSIAYLICRVVDNIEDCKQPFSWQQQRFAEFNFLLNQPDAAPITLQQWEAEAWPGLNADESALMKLEGGLTLWQIYAGIPEPSRSVIARWVTVMSQGMERLLNPAIADLIVNRSGIKLLATETEYDRYCFYVAGTVGRMATELIIEHYGVNGSQAKDLLDSSEICGRALQKTNIVKDFARDLERGMSFLPATWLRQVDFSPLGLRGAPPRWKAAVIHNVLDELDTSVDYVLDLPLEAGGYRRACLLAMMPAYQTLLLAAKRLPQLFTGEHDVKISRRTMAQCLVDAKRFAKDNDAISRYATKMSGQVTIALNHSTMVVTD